MTGATISPVTGMERAGTAVEFPFLGRLLIALSAVGTLLAAAVTVAGWTHFTQRWALLPAWLVTAAAGPVVVRWIARVGRMSVSALLGLATAVLGVDLVVPLLLDPADRLGELAWAWTTGAVLICVASAYRPPRDVLVLSGAHAGIAVTLGWLAGAGTVSTVTVVLRCVVPPLAAAYYLAIYTDGLLTRRNAVALRTRALALEATEQAQQQSIIGQVETIRNKIIDLLAAVADGDQEPAAASVRQAARTLSAALRRELDESRSRGWLLPATTPPGAVEGPTVDVLGPGDLLTDEGRAAVAGLVDLLGRYRALDQIVVTVSAGSPVTVELTVVASGPGADLAFQDPAVLAAVQALPGAPWYDAEAGSLVVEAELTGAVHDRSTGAGDRRDPPPWVSGVTRGRPMPD
jgi:hypothetical protein